MYESQQIIRLTRLGARHLVYRWLVLDNSHHASSIVLFAFWIDVPQNAATPEQTFSLKRGRNK